MPENNSAKEFGPFVPITQKFLDNLKSEIKRTGISLYQASKECNLTPKTIYDWMNGKTNKIKRENVEAVLNYYAKSPDKVVDSLYISQVLELLQAERRRTRIGAIEIIRVGSPPEKLNDKRVQNFFQGMTKNLTKDECDYLIETYKSLPTQIRFTDDMRRELKGLIDKNKIPKTAFGKKFYRSDNLTSRDIHHLLSGRKKYITEPQYEKIIPFAREYRPPVKIIESPKPPRLVALAEADIQKLESEIERTGIKPHSVLIQFGIKEPSYATVRRWLKRELQRVEPGYFDMILKAYSELPDRRH